MKTRVFSFPIALLVVMGSLFSGCSKNDNKDDNPDPEGGYDPVMVTGKVEMPAGLAIDATSLEVRGGVFSVAAPSESGEFSIHLNKSATQLVSAVQSNGNPVFLNIAVDPQSDTDIALNAFTTARSIIFLNPGVVVSEPGLAGTIMELIDQLPETAALAAQLEFELASDPDILVNENPAIHSALAAAIKALMVEVGKFSGTGNSKKSSHINQFRQLKHLPEATEPVKSGSAWLAGDLWISPSMPQSGLMVEAVKQSDDTYEIRITNAKKRYVNVYLDLPSGGNVGSAFLTSRNSVLSLQPLEPSTEKISAVLDVEAHPTSILYAYGPGALKHDDLANAPDWQDRIFKPVVYTAVYDFIFPLLDVISGVKNFKNPSPSSDPTDVYAFIIKEMTEDLTLRPQVATYLQVGDYSNALITAIKGAVQICIQNPTLISQYVKGKAAGAVLIPMLAAGLVGPLRAVLIGSSAIDLTSAFYDLATCAALEKWTISVAQSYEGVWNGTFYYTAEVPQDPPDPPLIVNTSFNLSVTLVSIASIPGFDQVLNITSVICSDPTFGATSPVVPMSPISLAMLPETFGSTSKWGMGFQIKFPNGSHIGTNSSIDGSFTVDLYGHSIANSNLVSEEAFSAGFPVYNSNDPGSGPGGYAYNWCTFTGWSFIRQGD